MSTTTTRRSIAEWLDQHDATVTAEAHGLQRVDDWDAYAFSVTLHLDGRTLTASWSQGTAHPADSVDSADVVRGIVSDALSVRDARDFEDWAETFGYDTDSRRAESLYRQCAALLDEVRAWSGGPGAFAELAETVESDQ